MLNKLLKRCMPWMDKGRWYKLVLVGSGDKYIVGDGTDPVFANVNVIYRSLNNEPYIELTGSNIVFIDTKIKFMIGGIFGYINALVSSGPGNTRIVFSTNASMGPEIGATLELTVFGR